MAKLRNVFACLVHESQECVADLIRNLRFLDPSSTILLYNGGRWPQLLDFELARREENVVCHPSPQPMNWGRLHDFALDCMRFALEHLPFDTLTIVDSDQLATRAGYSEYLAGFLEGRDKIGLLGSTSHALPPNTHVGPVLAAYQEIELWRPFLQRFPLGEEEFGHWSFWPSTVITASAARDLLQLFATDRGLQEIMERTKIWATEEVILPTLIALLGYEITANPCSYDYVQYRMPYTPPQIDAALLRPDVFWLHPIPRHYDDPLRLRVREALDRYQKPVNGGIQMPATQPTNECGLVLSLPILQAMRSVQGWLTEQEADLLLAATVRAVTSLPRGSSVVEVGSYCGRSTVVLGNAVKSLKADTKVYAIDPHDGVLGAVDVGVQHFSPTLATFQQNMAANELSSVVESIAKRSFEVPWNRPIALLHIDHLHDYDNVARDFRHFEPFLLPGAYVAFHDYVDYFPGVKKFVNELLAISPYQMVACSETMMVVRLDPDYKRGEAVTPAKSAIELKQAFLAPVAAEVVSEPLVSCIMPTANRRAFMPQALRHFLRQDYAKRELIILDDGEDSVADLIPQDDRIRYVRMDQRRTMGTKHNLACEMARGEIIVHWDDDDWMAEHRISYQVKQLLPQPLLTLCGLSRVLFYDPRLHKAWEYVYPQSNPPWVAGGTFCYFKRFWEDHRFPDMNEGADTVFVWNLQNVNVMAHHDHTFLVATVHSYNTSQKRTEGSEWHPLSTEKVQRLLGEQDWAFYERFGLQNGNSGLHSELGVAR